MISKECRVTRLEIDELELNAQPGEKAAAHLSACAPCRDFKRERAELRELVGGLEPVVAPPDFDMRLRARMTADRSNSNAQPFFAVLFRTPALAAAALFVVVAGTLVWVAQRGNQPSAPSVAGSSKPSTVGASDTAQDKVNDVVSKDDETPAAEPTQLAGNLPKKYRPVSRGPRSQDYSVREAPVVLQTDQAFVNAPSRPVVFGLENERGATRRISLPPVTFGAQSLVDNRTPVNYTANSRVW